MVPRHRFLRLLLPSTEISLVVHALHVAAFRVPPRKSEEIPGNIGDAISLLYARIAGPFRSFAATALLSPLIGIFEHGLNFCGKFGEFVGEIEGDTTTNGDREMKKQNLFLFNTLF